MADVFDVEKESIVSTGAVFVSSDSHVSIGHFIEVLNKFLNAFSAEMEANTNASSAGVPAVFQAFGIVDHPNNSQIEDYMNQGTKSNGSSVGDMRPF